MASNVNYISDKELTEMYNVLDKESLVKMLIKKYREKEAENIVKLLTIPSIGVSTAQNIVGMGNGMFQSKVDK